MAEGFLRKLAGDRFIAGSAGVEPGALKPIAAEVMKEAGIDISGQKDKDVKSSLKEHFAYVVTVSDDARERSPVFPFTPNLVHWNLEDPSITQGSPDEVKNAFRRVRDQVESKVREFIAERPRESAPERSDTKTASSGSR